MSCNKCEVEQALGMETYIRWKNANVLMSGCKEHLKEIIEVLRRCKHE